MGTAIITVFMNAIQAVFEGLGTGLQDLFATLIYDPTPVTGGLQPLAEWTLVFAGIAFALGIFAVLFRKIG